MGNKGGGIKNPGDIRGVQSFFQIDSSYGSRETLENGFLGPQKFIVYNIHSVSSIMAFV